MDNTSFNQDFLYAFYMSKTVLATCGSGAYDMFLDLLIAEIRKKRHMATTSGKGNNEFLKEPFVLEVEKWQRNSEGLETTAKMFPFDVLTPVKGL